ncbi:MAG: asparaginase [Propionicimonas sp.]|nr:asparaginase [Propionicimonas sp.]
MDGSDVEAAARQAGRYRGGVVLAEVVRSGFVEGFHRGSIAVLDASGRLVASAGDPGGAVFPRSSNKLMQAVAMLDAGLQPADEAELALVAASHLGEPMHTRRVKAMLDRAGLGAESLACPPDLPGAEAVRLDLLRAGGGPDRLFMNCSGKHAGMLLTCLAAGWPTAGYTAAGHPLQRAIRGAVEELAGEPVAATGVDGCSAPVMAISLTGLARAFLAAVTAPSGTSPRRVADAMRTHPELMSGTGAPDARLMAAAPGLLSKSGAEGVAAVAVPGVGAVAVKIDDGAGRARLPVVVAALGRLGIAGDHLAAIADTPVLGGGAPVGSVRAIPALVPAGTATG